MSLFSKMNDPILSPRKELEWASGAVFNPGAWYDHGTVHLLFRAIPAGYRRVPLVAPEPFGPTKGFDESYISSIGYASSTDGMRFSWRETPFILPDADFDRFGAEENAVARFQ